MSDRTLRQLCAQTIYKETQALIHRIEDFGKMTSPRAHEDSLEKLRKIKHRMVNHMHPEDRPV